LTPGLGTLTNKWVPTPKPYFRENNFITTVLSQNEDANFPLMKLDKNRV